jgi:hypothetical protein
LHRHPAASRAQHSGRQLLRLREAFVRAACGSGKPIVVAAYALLDPDRAVAPVTRLDEARASAAEQGWTVAFAAVDSTRGDLDPGLRPQLRRIHAAVRAGRIDGFVAASRVDISPHDSVYHGELERLHAEGGFLGLARTEVAW